MIYTKLPENISFKHQKTTIFSVKHHSFNTLLHLSTLLITTTTIFFINLNL
jgi:hypothetical protein